MAKRLYALSLAVILLFCSVLGRIGYIVFSGNYSVSSSYNSISVTVDERCANIYDCNMAKLTNKYLDYVAVIRPNEKCLSELNELFSNSEIKDIRKELSKGYPIVRSVDKYVDTKYIKIYSKTEHYSKNQLATHIISKYTNGVESKCKDAININSKMKINYSIDAKGRLLNGDEGKLEFDNYASREGISLTIDSTVQKIVENVIDSDSTFKKGAVVVLDSKTGKILCCASRPNIDFYNLSNTSNDYVNRAFIPYSVGSVFKLIVAACAIENGFDPTYNCTGKVVVSDSKFECLKGKHHGKQNIKEALENSCNCYFVKLAFALGADKVHETAKKFGFGSSMSICDGWKIENGNLPNLQVLKRSGGELALLSFGQGSLTSTPLQFASAVQTIVNDGVNAPPSIINGKIDKNGNIIKTKPQKTKRIISSSTAKLLQKYMRYVVTNGTASAAESSDKKSAGKTSTAQTGKFDGDEEILRTWISGFYPYDNPKYIIVVVNENGYSGSVSACPIFKHIVDKLPK